MNKEKLLVNVLKEIISDYDLSVIDVEVALGNIVRQALKELYGDSCYINLPCNFKD